MPSRDSLSYFVASAADEANRTTRRIVASGLAPFEDHAFHDFELNQLSICKGPPREFESQLSLLAVLHLLWSLVPEKLFTATDPDYRLLVQSGLDRVGLVSSLSD